jgi:hypothetical protein
MMAVFDFAAGREEPLQLVPNRVACCADETLAIGWQQSQINREAILGIRISRCDRLKNLIVWDGDRLAPNPTFYHEDGCFLLWSKTCDVENPFLMTPLVAFQGLAREFLRIVVYEFVTLRAQKHQVGNIVDVGRTIPRSTRALFTKRYNVGKLRKIAFCKSHMMFKEVLVASIKLAPPAGSHE